jgi:hypothetical protein
MTVEIFRNFSIANAKSFFNSNSSSYPSTVFIIHLSLLIELLEQFPLPVPLQTQQKNMIQQNYLWREPIEKLILSSNTSVCFLSSQKLQFLSDQVVALAQTPTFYFPSSTT